MKLNNCLLDDHLVREAIKTEMEDILEFNGNEGITYPNVSNKVKAVLRGKFISLSPSIKKFVRFHTTNLKAHLKASEQKKQTHLSRIEGRKESNSGQISRH